MVTFLRKTILVLLVLVGAASIPAFAQTATAETPAEFSIADSSSFTGKYKYEGMPFEYMTITVQGGRLFYSGGEYSGPLDPVKGKKDAFDASGRAVFTFLRSADQKVAELRIDYDGQSFVGKREQKKG